MLVFKPNKGTVRLQAGGGTMLPSQKQVYGDRRTIFCPCMAKTNHTERSSENRIKQYTEELLYEKYLIPNPY
jgi:hypothetical protein